MITCNNFINNKFHEDGSSDYIDVLNPSDGGVVGKVVRGWLCLCSYVLLYCAVYAFYYVGFLMWSCSISMVGLGL